ncbi:uncharacterized protein [Antedon mediterranea]|uniref:uncharacterized protein isoform X2 n=1 Tax=Antedon mediterranea TaxID=105859 RepID=UPI003AF7D79E
MYRALIFATLMSIAFASLFEDVRELKELLEFEEEERQIEETQGKKETLSKKASLNYIDCMTFYDSCNGNGDCEVFSLLRNIWLCQCTNGYTGPTCNTQTAKKNQGVVFEEAKKGNEKRVVFNEAKKSYGGLVQKLRELLEEENY